MTRRLYRITFDRIGRNHSIVPIVEEANDADELAEKIYRFAKRGLASRFPDVVVDLEEMNGFIATGVHIAGRFTIEVMP